MTLETITGRNLLGICIKHYKQDGLFFLGFMLFLCIDNSCQNN